MEYVREGLMSQKDQHLKDNEVNKMGSKPKEALAIVGMSCRYPGNVNSPEEFWELLTNKEDALGDIPTDRWDVESLYAPEWRRAGKINVKRGGFIKNIDRFDAGFFGISPLEASRMDPQQRMLLELSYEALEDGGLRLEELSGSDTAVYVGLSAHDYGDIQNTPSERVNIGSHTNVGSALSITANRISYSYDLHGPSFALDTACSSSLNAIHMACRSIWNGEASGAFAGGVNSILKPEPQMGFSKGGFLSPDGTCYSFDKRGNGYVRSEGAGLIFLKPLSQAEADGDDVYAVIRGSAVNQDGTTNGISVPSRDAQESLLRTAYADAGVDPHDVSFVEAHGTGTFVGDPIESDSIGKVIGKEREDDCYMGSVKSNMGHLEPASGIAGLSKLALSMKKGVIPPNIHFQEGNPNIDFDSLKLRVPTENEDWPVSEDKPKFGGVNSFGFGGSNAHLVLQDHKKKVPPQNGEAKGPRIFTISARDQNALEELAQRYIDFMGSTNGKPYFEDICRTSAIRRTHHDIRLAVVAESKDELADDLRAYLDGESLKEVAARRKDQQREQCVFIFSGQGPQWWGMGRELYQKEPLFRSWIEKLDGMLSEHADWSLIEELTKDEENTRISDTNIAQPALFAVQIALYEMWKAIGVQPSAVVGHSIGEVAAGYVSGALTLEQAVLLIFHRSRVQFKATDKGRMLAVGLPYEEAKKLTEGHEGKVSVGAVNGPEMVTLSGDMDRIESIAEDLNERDVFHRMLMVNVPFHSHHMEPLRDELLASLGDDFQPSATHIPFYSTVEGDKVDGRELTPDYWYRNVREPVFLTSAIEAQARDGFDTFIELGPHPIHASGVNDTLKQEKQEGLVLPSIRRKEAEKRTFLSSAAALHTWGFKLDWEAFYGKGHGFVDLPRYPWQRESYWLEREASKEVRLGTLPYGHPHLRHKSVSAREPNNVIWDVELDKRCYPYINDHKVQGPIIYPGAGHVDLVIAAARASFGDKFSFVEKVDFENGLFLPDSGEPPDIQMDISHDGGEYFIYTRPYRQEDAPWSLCSQGRIDHLGSKFDHIPVDLEDIKERVNIPVPVKPMQDELHESGLYLGPSFRNIKNLWRSNGSWEALSEIEVHESIQDEFFQFNVHPGVLDSCFQTVFGIFNEREDANKRMGVYVPRHIESIKWYNDVDSYKLYVHGRLREWTDQHALGELWIFNEDGTLVAEFHGFQSQYLKGSRGEEEQSEADWYYEYKWNMKPRVEQERLRDPGEYLKSPLEIQKDVDETLETVRNRSEQGDYYETYEPEQYQLTVAYIVRALSNMGISFEKGNKFHVETLIKEMEVVEEQERLFHHLFKILKDAGILQGGDGYYEVKEEPDLADVFSWMDDLKERFPQFLHESTLLGRCGPQIQNVIQGEVDPVQLIFPEDDWQAILQYYVEGFAFKKYNDIACRAVSELIRDLPENQTLRILEVGAGVGGVTQAILPLLPPERTEYVFTDLSRMFTMKAQEQFAKYPFVSYDLLDIEQDPEEQGFDTDAYDLVIASDVIHATSRLSNSLENVRKLLASEGQLLLLEVTNSPVYLDLIFGMTEGWWMFQDTDIRPHHATMPPENWKEVLESNSFHDVNWFSDFPKNEASCQSVLLARSEQLDLSENQESQENESAQADWLVFTDEGKVAEKVIKELEDRNKRCVRVRKGEKLEELSETEFVTDPQDQEGADRTIDELAKGQGFEGILFAWGLDNDGQDIDAESLLKAEEQSSVMLMNIMRKLNDMTFEKNPSLWVLFAGAQTVDSRPELPNLKQEGERGVARVILNEFPNYPTTLVDLSDPVQDEELDELLSEFFAQEYIEEMALRGRKRYVNRLERVSQEQIAERAKRRVNAEEASYQATITEYGVLDNVVLRETERREPAPDEVEVRIKASALNFRDIMIAMGLLSDEAVEGGLFGHTFGLECSGVVTAVGKNVDSSQVGDEVMATAAACLGGFAYPKGAHVVKKPERISWAEAASLPVVYTTAYFSLIHHCRIEEGERVLIHAAAGGVGIAAINIANTIGAEVFATCSTQEKQDHIEKLGVKRENIMNSRSYGFADDIMEKTDGEGVDVVINSLSGESIYKSIQCLAAYGRFVEIGKTDIYRNSKLGLQPFGNNLSYFGVDVDRLFAQKVDFGGKLFQRSIDHFVENGYEPHPVTVFPVGQLPDAFQFMGGARHIGKVIISMEGELDIAPAEEIQFDEDASYMITGGASGFGLAVADWMTRKGARNLVLMSRSGPKTDDEKERVKQMEERGVNVLLPKGDVSSKADMDRIFKEVEDQMPPLKGVQHAAMVLDDGSIPEIDRDRYMKVFGPKAVGCWLLHEHTKDKELDHFVSYSSISAVFGNPGQVSYVGANSFLDNFAHWRQAQGLPATTINWGVIGDVGFVARSQEVDGMLYKQGWKSFTLDQALHILEQMLLNKPVNRVATDSDWETVGEFFPHVSDSSRFAHLVHEKEMGGGAGEEGDGALKASILEADASEQKEMLEEALTGTFARVLGTTAKKLDVTEPTSKYGLDSLMANQVRNWIQSNFGIDYSMMRIMRGPTIEEMTQQILDEMSGEEVATNEGGEEKSELDLWIPRKKKVENPRLRLFCFPYFAGGASVFSDWHEQLPDDIEVCPVQFPGREERADEKAYDNVFELVQKMAEVIEPMLSIPVAFYSHSSGAGIAFELARYLRREMSLEPVKFIVGGWRAPDMESPFPHLQKIDDSEVYKDKNIPHIKDHLRSLEIPDNVVDNDELFNEMLPALRADILLGKKYDYYEEEPLNVPIIAIGGTEDSVFSEKELKEWRKHTASDFDFQEVKGGHLFCRDNKEELLELLKDKLAVSVEA